MMSYSYFVRLKTRRIEKVISHPKVGMGFLNIEVGLITGAQKPWPGQG